MLCSDLLGLFDGLAEVEQTTAVGDRGQREARPADGCAGEHIRQPVGTEQHAARSDDADAFAEAWGDKKNALGKCVSATVKADDTSV